MATRPEDRRRQRTRAALLAAFGELVVAQPYDTIRIGDALARAGIGRSTFYEHFRDKDHLLRAAIAPPLAGLAALLDAAGDPGQATFLLAHFAQNRRRALAMLRGAPHRHLVRALREQVEPHLRERGAERTMLATQIAGAMLALMEAWLGEELAVAPAVLAARLQAGARALSGARAATARS